MPPPSAHWSVDPVDPRDLHAAIERAWIVVWQAGRLAHTQAQALAEDEARSRAGGTYRASNRHPFHRMNADRRFLLIAARDLMRALDRIGEGDRLPAAMRQHIEVLRNISEHWDDQDGPSRRRFAAAGGDDPHAHRWGAGGTVLGEFLDVECLVAVAQQAYDDLVAVEEGPVRHRRPSA